MSLWHRLLRAEDKSHNALFKVWTGTEMTMSPPIASRHAGLKHTCSSLGILGILFLLFLGISPAFAANPLKQLKVTATSPTYNSATNTYDSAVTITNRANQTFSGDLQLLISQVSKPGVALANLSGTNSKNKPYIDISVPTDGLAKNQSVNALLQFTNAKSSTFRFKFRLIRGLSDYRQSLPPTADAGPDQTVSVTGTANLNGSKSSDPLGRPITFLWNLLDKPEGSQSQLSNPAIPNPALPIDQAGHYTAQLIVNNGLADSAADSVIIDTSNSKPQADAGKAITGKLRETVTLDGTGSHDADGDVLSYQWTLPVKPKRSKAALENADTASPSFKIDRKGNYQAELIVNDGHQDSDPSSVAVSTIDSAPVADAGPDRPGELVSQAVTLDGSASTDADNDLYSFRWALIYKPEGSQATLVDPLAIVAQFLPDLPGDYIAQLITHDGSLASKPATAEITVAQPIPVNHPPAITSSALTSATVGNPYSYNVTATDADHDTLTFSLPTAPTGMTFDASAQAIVWTPSGTGQQSVTVKVDDGKGGSDTQSFTITVSVPQATVPNLVGLSRSAAETQLVQNHLVIGNETFQFSATVADGQVISQVQAPSTVLSVGASIDFAISKGPDNGLPANPQTTAPRLDPSVVSTTYSGTQFLYSGPNAVQTGVAPGTIDDKRVAVIRGKVMDKQDHPLSGVAITIKDHSEFGQTLSRADGLFDMAVNGGGVLTVNYQKAGYLPVQRQVNAPWQDFVQADEVVMITRDAAVTNVNFTSTGTTLQVARGSVVTDSDGTRQATVLFPAGTTAQIYDAQGNLQTVDNLHLHFTEYTVGANGLKTMPAALPPTSGYTYALELTADEVTTKIAGQDVLFNQPVPFYLDNFLGIAVGTHVPVGFYDAQKAAWVPAPDGRIVKIVAISNGLADLDTDGDTVADNSPALGITDAERTRLGSLYAAGQSLERIPLTHFSIYDFNFPTICTPGQTCPVPSPGPITGGTGPNTTIDDGGAGGDGGPGHCPPSGPTLASGSLIECENQILGEAVPITGTPLSLNYRSDRVPGRKLTLQIPLTGQTVPPNLQHVDLVVTVAGRAFMQSFSADANQSYAFTWDGLDAYGRALQGHQPASIFVNYSYPGVYNIPSAMAASFGLPGSGQPLIPSRRPITTTLTQTSFLGAASAEDFSDHLGNWTLSEHHTYDPISKTVYLGTGTRQRADAALGSIITTVAGNGVFGYSGDGGPATAAQISNSYEVAIAPDGSLYISDGNNDLIRRVGADGLISTVAGLYVGGSSGNHYFNGDGIPATNAILYGPEGLAFAPDGSLYIADTGRQTIQRVGLDGVIHIVAGSFSGVDGDGGPATSAWLYDPTSVVIAPDGTLYIADYRHHRIRRVGPDGIITTLAGNGTAGYGGDGGAATAAQLNFPRVIALAPNGSLYIAEELNYRIRRVDPDGVITTVAGNGTAGYSGDGGSATDAELRSPYGVAIAPDGSLYIADTGNGRIRRVGADGLITTVAGNGQGGYSGDGGLATAAGMNPYGITFAPDGSLYIADTSNRRIRKISSTLPGVGIGDFLIPSANGRELYQFDSSGRHLKTLNPLTNAVKYQFTYDSSGLLTALTDGDGNKTTIERDATGKALAIVAPFGQRTTLTHDSHGFLASVGNPAGETHRITYSDDGLLQTFSDPNGHASTMAYDASGRLTKDSNAAGGSKTLARTDLNSTDYLASIATGLGRTTTHKIEYPAAGGMKRTDTAPDGTVTTRAIATDGSTTMTTADGTSISSLAGPDPRFSMMAPLQKSFSATTGGLTSTQSTERTVNLSDPSNPLSLTSLTDTFTLNGRTSTSVFDVATKMATSTSAAGRVATGTVDAQGRLLTSQIAGLNAVTATYDTFGRLATVAQGASPDDRTVSFGYNAQGYLASVTDPLSRSVGFEYDLAGRVTRQTLPDGRQILYGYDKNGNLASLQPPGKSAHVFQYTAVDQNSTYAPPAVAGVANGNTTYVYDIDKALTDIVRPDGQTLHLNYNATSGNPTSLVLQPANKTLDSYSYDAVTGKLKTITDQLGGSLNYTYNGALLTQVAWTGAITGTVDVAYDTDFRVKSLTADKADPAALAVAYGYDADSLLTQAGDLVLTRNAQNGLLTNTTLGKVTDSRSYDGFGAVTAYASSFDASALLQEHYTYDKLGRITQTVETVQGTANTLNYGYDPAGRLSEVKLNGAVQSTYTYDDNGNRLTGPGLTTAPTYDGQDRLLTYGTATFAYTDNGELTSKTVGATVTTYHYDVLGNLLQVGLPGNTTIDYVVDGKNRRIGKKVNGTLVQGFLYQDQLKPIAELDGNNAIVSRFIYATHVNVPDYMIKGGITYRIITDHLGSPRLVVNTTDGSIAQQMNFDEFGRVTLDSNPGFQPFGFAGGLYDRDTGLVRFGARDYDAVTGRWMSKDPIGFGGGDSNFYGYVINNPTMLVDPNGMNYEDDFFNWCKDRWYCGGILGPIGKFDRKVIDWGLDHLRGKAESEILGEKGAYVIDTAYDISSLVANNPQAYANTARMICDNLNGKAVPTPEEIDNLGQQQPSTLNIPEPSGFQRWAQCTFFPDSALCEAAQSGKSK